MYVKYEYIKFYSQVIQQNQFIFFSKMKFIIFLNYLEIKNRPQIINIIPKIL